MKDRATCPDAAAAAHHLEGNPSPHVGSFRYLLADDTWEWSDAVAAMHGYAPGTVQPTTALLLQHKHPDDKKKLAELLEAVRTTGEPFSSRHRIIDTAGNIKSVAVIGDRLVDENGAVLGTSGFYLDLSEAIERDIREGVDEAVSALTGARAVIEQAKGILIAVYAISAQHAFEILTWRSQESNVKVRALSEQLVAETTAGAGAQPVSRREFDHLLMTLHERVPEA
ncbi:PAS and ANTAR domain-containing protein [Rhodococcus artemisiae]|uniref:PAS and ANTAR domain-containing protein n=1 Tax=Rhodococcus artemisiae TaxID=714159 RepID=A0ABU7LCL1_9NOCA|nr:PAS and ANTAR domain-containing protein [Rhodococcus artemisiae]MEE2059291.1 PAS and ANTAR domain-containing protein [Rhodococcus artemisiae]